ncbi:MAG TPA: transglycosylase domain-containing protein [Candidatus Limnocylindria bacterium]|nr:transglycosylase domain-containing protein [Candidatus Limnocylindria bacterium]
MVAAVPLALILCGIIYISYNRTDLPDSHAFIRFEPPTMGHIYDANGHVLIALARERREIIQYKDVPDVLRQAILSAEDENFFSHAGVDFSVFPRMLGKTNVHALFANVGGTGGENAAEHAQVFPQGGLPAQRWAWQDRFYERVKNVCRKHGRNCAQNRRRLGQAPINRAYL